MEYAQTKQVVETVCALGKNAWLWAKDLMDGHYNASLNKKDTHKLGFVFDEKIYMFQGLPMKSSSFPNIFTDFMHFLILAMKQEGHDLYYKEVLESMINLKNFIKDANVIKEGSAAILEILFSC